MGTDINLHNWLWCGFYGSILILFFLKSTIYKVITIMINLAIILFCAFVSLMGGVNGVFIVLVYLLLPFFSFFHMVRF